MAKIALKMAWEMLRDISPLTAKHQEYHEHASQKQHDGHTLDIMPAFVTGSKNQNRTASFDEKNFFGERLSTNTIDC